MIEVIDAPDHVAAFHVAGTVTAADYDKIIPEIEETLADHPEIGVLADLSGMEDMTGEAIQRDLQYGMGKLGELHRFKRAAVISDKQWIKGATDMAGKLFPQIDTQVFSPDERDEALQWVSDLQ
ncbi:STAS/SEC14 domain-containing protein [Devosia sp. YIM 151766]|uniref:STAS/SEC14 domain-containing protein n=1 Tax=Devosia sp. YIM 151766 TaxID=3017325 RepID=UPI00255CC56A|nr:STAS/SEC14 domain-containing protein [Devosia sp. YIM 151766]WIY52393.1 STAS/SEC14 domain-containing protein [Devosia sp. YIM 151766]